MANNKSYFHSGGETSLLGQTIPQRFGEIVSIHREQDAIVSLPQNQQLTYQEFSDNIDTVAKGLLALGFK